MSKALFILGISAFYHDSAASLLKDGQIIAAAQEERFSRKKHDPSFPRQAIEYCLKEGQIEINQLAQLVFYDKPLLTFERLLLSYLTTAPRGIRSWLQSMPLWLKKKLFIPNLIKRETGFKGNILFSEHHEAHAASAFYPSPFSSSAILTIDGVGEWTTASIGRGSGKELSIIKELHFPDSLGLLYSAFTYFTGFRVNSGEYKLMGLAPYGQPKYKELILTEIVDLKDDGSLRLNMRYFDFLAGLKMTNRKFAKLFGGPARRPESEISKREMDIAASIQAVTEEAVLRMANHAFELTKEKNLCLAGGVALNCVANGRLLKESPFNNIWIQPAAGDAGGSLGAAYSIWHRFLAKDREVTAGQDKQAGSYLGPSFSNATIKDFLLAKKYPFHSLSGEERSKLIAEQLKLGKVVGYFAGRMEFGPRALGARSILGDPRSSETQTTMNLKIKHRESFRPFAPSVIKDRATDYFDLSDDSPYMLLVSKVKSGRCLEQRVPQTAPLLERLKEKRSDIPAITHLDYSARVQTVNRQDKEDYFQVIEKFEQLTGCAVVVNTSFNVRGEPIVCTPEDAYRCFMRTEMDVLVLEDQILYKEEQPKWPEQKEWQNDFKLD